MLHPNPNAQITSETQAIPSQDDDDALDVQCRQSAGSDAGKLIKRKKRHVLVEMLGLVLHALVVAVDMQHRGGRVLLLSRLFGQFPLLRKLFADSAYSGPIFRDGVAKSHA